MSVYKNIQIGKQDKEEYPETISKFWIHIDEMKSLFSQNQTFINNLNTLKTNSFIIAWKRSRGDGNCYYRAVISTFFLTITKPYMPVEHLQQFLNNVSRLDTSNSEYEYKMAMARLVNRAQEMIRMKIEGGAVEVFELALGLTQDMQFDLDLVRFARMVTAEEIVRCHTDENYSMMFIDGIDSVLYGILEMGREGGDYSLIFLPKAIGIQVVQYMYLESPRIVVQKFPEEVPVGTIVVNIMRRECHYDILCNLQQMEKDQFNIEEGTYNFIKPEIYQTSY